MWIECGKPRFRQAKKVTLKSISGYFNLFLKEKRKKERKKEQKKERVGTWFDVVEDKVVKLLSDPPNRCTCGWSRVWNSLKQIKLYWRIYCTVRQRVCKFLPKCLKMRIKIMLAIDLGVTELCLSSNFTFSIWRNDSEHIIRVLNLLFAYILQCKQDIVQARKRDHQSCVCLIVVSL